VYPTRHVDIPTLMCFGLSYWASTSKFSPKNVLGGLQKIQADHYRQQSPNVKDNEGDYTNVCLLIHYT